MTPLAHRIVKELTLPVKDRTFNDKIGLLPLMSDIHCFDVSEIWDLVYKFIGDATFKSIPMDERSSFLPFPKTWIETIDYEHEQKPTRIGALFVEKNNKRLIDAYFSFQGNASDQYGTFEVIGAINKINNIPLDYVPRISEDRNMSLAYVMMASLPFINSPRIINQQTHAPHKGLERKLLAKRPIIGSFPLHAWTEIKLSVSPPKDMLESGSKETHYTGQKALHWCRAHLRIRLGRLEIVRAHLRGDASLGMKQSRYKLK